MANEQNLKPLNERTKKEQREIAKKGGIASGESRRQRKTLKEELEILLEQNKTQEKMAVALVKRAMKHGEKTANAGNKAFEIIRDTIGEKPKEQIEHSGDIGNPFKGLTTEELRQLIKDD